MSMSNCPRCWNTLCTCGERYKHMSINDRIKLAAVVLGVSKELLSDKMLPYVPTTHPGEFT